MVQRVRICRAREVSSRVEASRCGCGYLGLSEVRVEGWPHAQGLAHGQDSEHGLDSGSARGQGSALVRAPFSQHSEGHPLLAQISLPELLPVSCGVRLCHGRDGDAQVPSFLQLPVLPVGSFLHCSKTNSLESLRHLHSFHDRLPPILD